MKIDVSKCLMMNILDGLDGMETVNQQDLEDNKNLASNCKVVTIENLRKFNG